MNGDNWQDQNNRYLAASLEWLRARLRLLTTPPLPATSEAAVPQAPPQAPPPADPGGKSSGILSRWLGSTQPGSAPPAPTQRLLPEAKPATPPQQPAESEYPSDADAAAAREAAANMDPPPALVMLAQRFGLSAFERDTLLLCAAVEYDPGFAAWYARVHGNPARNYPSFAIALAALDDPSWEALAAHRPLRQDRLIEISQPGATPLTSSALRADERIVSFLKGLNVIDERLTTLLTSVDTAGAEVSPSQAAAATNIVDQLDAAVQESALPVVQLVGSDAGSKLAVVRQVCATLRRQLFRLGAESLPQQPVEIETLARLWQRENFLLPVALYIDAESLDGASAEAQAVLQRFASRELGVAFLSVRDAPLKLNAQTLPVEVPRPTAEEQFEEWRNTLSATLPAKDASSAAALLAGQFDLNFGDIKDAAALASKSAAGQAFDGQRVWDTCRDLTRPRLDVLAQKLDVKSTWDDLVLPDEQMGLMRAVAGQVRARHTVYDDWGFSTKMNRGFGITALFAGESGTGKTMAAEVIANDLRLNLYRIDLSAVVSKYIGETEKNLRRLFDAAEQGGAILFFDEADALFGKRSEVKDSHDRYANIEINYLLQRMEAFSGLAILATNMKTALDPAFLRRLRFVVNFQFPGPKERKLIWQKSLPAATPQEDLDYDRLARLNINGGHIHSIALNAAFLAAQSNQPVTTSLLLTAARTEMRKLEKPASESEFRP